MEGLGRDGLETWTPPEMMSLGTGAGFVWFASTASEVEEVSESYGDDTMAGTYAAAAAEVVVAVEGQGHRA